VDRIFLPFSPPSPQAEKGKGGEEGRVRFPTPNPSPLAGRGNAKLFPKNDQKHTADCIRVRKDASLTISCVDFTLEFVNKQLNIQRVVFYQSS